MRVLHVGNRPTGTGGVAAVILHHLRRDWSVVGDYVVSFEQDAATMHARQGAALHAATRLVRTRPTPDLVLHFHLTQRGSWAREGLLMLLAKARGHRALVVTVHGSGILNLSRVALTIARHSLAFVGVVHVLSQAHASALMSGRVVLIPNDVPVPEEALPMADREPLIVFAGELGFRKGTDLLLAAWERVRLPRWTLALCGPSHRGRPVPAVGDTIPASVRVCQLSREELDELLRRSSIFALPSRAEALPMSVCEAMANGCAIVATDVGGNRDLLGDHNPYLIPPNDQSALEVALAELMTNADVRAREGQRNHDRAREYLSTSIVTTAWAQLYGEMASRPRRAPGDASKARR